MCQYVLEMAGILYTGQTTWVFRNDLFVDSYSCQRGCPRLLHWLSAPLVAGPGIMGRDLAAQCGWGPQELAGKAILEFTTDLLHQDLFLNRTPGDECAHSSLRNIHWKQLVMHLGRQKLHTGVTSLLGIAHWPQKGNAPQCSW